MATLFLSRYLVPVSTPPVEDGAILVDRGRIVGVGTKNEMTAASPDAAVVDYGDAILAPPLVNAHTHLELTDFPRWVAEQGEAPSDSGFVSWVLHVIQVKRNLDLALFEPSLVRGIDASLAAGTGAVGDILSYFPARYAYRTMPLKGRLYLETLGRDPAIGRKVLSGIGDILKEQRCGLLSLGIAPHSPYSASGEYLEEIYDLARRRKVPTTLHLGESRDEVDFLMDSTGPVADQLFPFVGWHNMVPPPARRSPVAYARDRKALVPSSLFAHGVQVDQRDVEMLKQSGAAVALCPRSNARLGVGKAPVALYREAGVPLALGTDSLASNDSLSVWDEIAFARQWFEGELSPAELLAMATVNGARALGLEAEMGTLAEGMGCNFQLLRPPTLPPLGELEEFLCSPGRTAEVEGLFLDAWDVLQKA